MGAYSDVNQSFPGYVEAGLIAVRAMASHLQVCWTTEPPTSYVTYRDGHFSSGVRLPATEYIRHRK